MSTETAAILDEAANVIRRNGFHQGGMVAPVVGKQMQDCPVCTWGAVSIAVCGTPEPLTNAEFRKTMPAITSLGRFLKLSGAHGLSVPRWNDHPDRTAEQVIAALEGAARAEREAAS